MSRRIFKTLLVATVVGLAYPVQAAVAKQVDDQMVAVVQVTQSAPLVSEKTAGLTQVTNTSSPVLPSEITSGLVQPFSHTEQPVLISTNDNGFDWSDASIGAGALFGTMLLGAAAAWTLRRHRGTLAH